MKLTTLDDKSYGETVKNLIKKLSEEIEMLKQKDLLTNDWISQYGQYARRKRFHGRMLGVITKIGHDLGYVVDIERGWELRDGIPTDKGKRRWAVSPDITFLDELGSPKIFIDFNTIDMVFSIDGKLKDFEFYLKNGEEGIPNYCLLIQTLPKISIIQIKGKPIWLNRPDLELLQRYNIKNYDKTMSLWQLFHERSVINALKHYMSEQIRLIFLSEDEIELL